MPHKDHPMRQEGTFQEPKISRWDRFISQVEEAYKWLKEHEAIGGFALFTTATITLITVVVLTIGVVRLGDGLFSIYLPLPSQQCEERLQVAEEQRDLLTKILSENESSGREN